MSRQLEQVKATAPANAGVPVSAALRPHPRQVVVVNVVLLDDVEFQYGGRLNFWKREIRTIAAGGAG